MVRSEQEAEILTETKPAIRVAIQGYAGAFHDIAARFCFKDNEVEVVPANTFESLIHQLETDHTIDQDAEIIIKVERVERPHIYWQPIGDNGLI